MRTFLCVAVMAAAGVVAVTVPAPNDAPPVDALVTAAAALLGAGGYLLFQRRRSHR